MAESGMIVDHDNESFRRRWASCGSDRFNGAFYYSKEIVKHIIPRVNTDRNWVLINQRHEAFDHSIVFIHNNVHPENYDWLSEFDDLILVCGVPETCAKVEHLGKTLYLPLSVDVRYVETFKRSKVRDTAFVGRASKAACHDFGDDVRILSGLPRTRLLPAMAKFRRVYAVGRTAIEARILGCELLAYDPRFPDPSIWKVLDSREAGDMLNDMVAHIDGRSS